ncbi:MAG: tRNA (adenosine(37)-N6)-dimethylallyltransferase MiaA [Candidatus Hydrogenedentes bacterium]|nr:tRNA (adenosine(37)-N6)-dimethylallyltransferase MiaA [Candidatus Hydrogenedentota bacterium]
MEARNENLLVVLGATASGKTGLGARLAHALGGEVISADSRQVYRGLDIGSGKDLHEYLVEGHQVPYHLIDVCGLDEEYSLFAWQQAFYHCFEDIRGRGALPVLVGGTGLYLEAALQGYRMVEAPPDVALRAELARFSDHELRHRLLALQPQQHNQTDLVDRDRMIRAIEIAQATLDRPPDPAPEIRAFILGIAWPRAVLRDRIARRLRERLSAGLIEEVAALHDAGHTWERLELLGLEYRYVSQYLRGEIRNRNDLFQRLDSAICQFAKRQDTWFRRMERRGINIHWIPEGRWDAAWALARPRLGRRP